MAEFNERTCINKELQQASNQSQELYQLITMSDGSPDPEDIIVPTASTETCSSAQASEKQASANNFRKKSIFFLNSLKNTTLSASRILTKQNQSIEENKGTKKPVDLEAHIIFDDSKKHKSRLKFLRALTSSRNETDSGNDLYPVKVLTPNEEFSEADEDYEDDLYLEENSEVKNIIINQNNNVCSYDDEEDDYNEDNFDEIPSSGNELEVFSCENNAAQYASVVFCNNTDTLDNMQKFSKIHKDVSLKIAEGESDDEAFGEIDDIQSPELVSKPQSNIKASYSYIATNKLSTNLEPRSSVSSVCSAKTTQKLNPNKAKLINQNLANKYSNAAADQQPSGLVKSQSKLNLKLPMAPPIIKSSSSFKIPNSNIGSRQSVSFSANTSFKNKEPFTNNELDTSHSEKQSKVIYQRNSSMPETTRKDKFIEGPSLSEPCRPTQHDDLEQDYLRSAKDSLEDKKSNSHLSPYLYSASNSTSHLLSNSSILSYNNSYMNFSIGNISATQNAPSRVLQKSMTTGSKAMRIMGNNNSMSPSETTSKLSISSKGSSVSKTSAALKKQQQRRLFFKNGNINISRSNINKRRRRYLTDIFTTLIDLKWRYNIGVFALGFLISWIGFACAWYAISYVHGDLARQNPGPDHVKCIANLNSFVSAILFSIETQQTIGYGARFTTEKCPEAIFIMMIQSSIGVMIQSFMVGVVFAKLSRPKKRSETLMFSKNAVISLRDGRLCLICRVGDMRKSHIVEAHVRMYLIKKKVTQEGEILPLHMYDLNVGWATGADRLFLVWPLTIEHYIDEDSPFWNISADDLRKERFELAVILEGIVESTGMTTQARSSYLTNEILWGHRFEKLITFQKEDGAYKIDYSRFNMTIPIDTPTCSAKDLHDLKEQEQEQLHNSNNYNDISHSSSYRGNLSENYHNDLRKRRIEAELAAAKNPRPPPVDIPEIVISNNNLLSSRSDAD